MKNPLHITEIDSKLEPLVKACRLGDYQNKIYGKINKYFSHKSYSRLIITLRLLFFNLKSLLGLIGHIDRNIPMIFAIYCSLLEEELVIISIF